MAELAPHHPPITNSDINKPDQAFSIDDLEYIRSRLFQLLDRVNKSMMEKVLLHESLTQISIGRLRSMNIDELSMKELMDKLSQDNKTLTTRCSKRRCRPCPLCLERTVESPMSASVGSCEICEVNGLCHRCYSSCPSCQRTTCTDCLLSCADCGTSHQCSDCAVFGEGKCNICREQPKTVHQSVNGNGSDRAEVASTENVNMNVQQTSTYSNKMVCIPHRSQTPLQLPQSCLTRPAPLIHLPPSALAPSKPHNYLAPVVHPQKGMLPTIHDIQTKPTPMTSKLIRRFNKPQKRAPVAHQQNASLPTISDIQTKPTSMTSELFSIHRFLISNKGMIGVNVSTLYPNRRCIVSNVIPNSVAFHLGVEVDDEITVSKSTTFEYSNIYDLLLNDIKHRPLLFEVKRAHKSNAETLAREGPHSLHRFTITEPGSLGITIIDHGNTATIVSRVIPNSLGDIYGLRVSDIICDPFESVLSYAKSGERPWILEVWRAVPTTTDCDCTGRLHVQAGCSVENPFIFSFPISNNVSKNQTNEKVAGDEVASSIRKDDDDEGNAGQEDGLAATDKGNAGSEVIVIDDDDE